MLQMISNGLNILELSRENQPQLYLIQSHGWRYKTTNFYSFSTLYIHFFKQDSPGSPKKKKTNDQPSCCLIKSLLNKDFDRTTYIMEFTNENFLFPHSNLQITIK